MYMERARPLFAHRRTSFPRFSSVLMLRTKISSYASPDLLPSQHVLPLSPRAVSVQERKKKSSALRDYERVTDPSLSFSSSFLGFTFFSFFFVGARTLVQGGGLCSVDP